MSAETVARPGRRAPRAGDAKDASGAEVEWLVDNAAAYDAVLDAMCRARHHLWISQLAFDADCRAYGATPGDAGRLLFDAVRYAASRGVDVRILLNESLLLDTATPLRAALAAAGASSVRVRGISRFPSLLHAKIVVVDAREAILVGSPFANGYWDDARHRPTDARRPVRELGGRPLHDVSTRVTGDAARTLGALFAELWNDASGATAEGDALHVAAAPASARAVRIVRTTPRGSMPQRAEGDTEILPALLDAIAGARSTIYIEHQYLSARPIVAALAAALARASELEMIVVLNQNPDVTAYRGWQNALLRDTGLLTHPRVGLFGLWSVERERDGGPWAVNQLFVHSKVVIVDDAWAMVGSANLDGVSLHSYGDDFSSWLGRRVFRNVRNFDVNLVVDADASVPASIVLALRDRLWGEHLGVEPGTIAGRPSAGWLARWRAAALRNARALDGDDAASHAGFLLPYSTRSTPAAQLADVGVRMDARRIDLRFDPSWLEVHCSPNWVRNMFA